jgi:rhamnulokinase
MKQKAYLAVDLGASNGRILAGLFDGGRLELEEIHRFSNVPVVVNGRSYWRTFELWGQILAGLRLAARRFGDDVESVGVDAWGVDFGLLDRGGGLLAAPATYRDVRTRGMMDLAFDVVARADIFAATGVQFMGLNTLYQLLAVKRSGSPPLDRAARLLMMPDLFHWMLSGEQANELTIASTTQLFDPRMSAWSEKLIDAFEFPRDIFGPIAQPGTTLGRLTADVAQETGLHRAHVVLPGSHDTASAVLAVPAASGAPTSAARDGSPAPEWCYVSSGTWSLMGVELRAPMITEQVFACNFTNESGVGGATRLLKNIPGMWLLQECQRVWKSQGQSYDWATLMRLAIDAPSFAAAFDPDDPRLLAPHDMPAEIAALCGESGRPGPASPGAMVRCILESLAIRHHGVLQQLEALNGRRIECIHLVGGGSQNQLLCQLVADACGRPVLAGPAEATALGNVLAQAIASGEIADVADARRVVRASFDVVEYSPRPDDRWQALAEFAAGAARRE